jgi:hypothetical protein
MSSAGCDCPQCATQRPAAWACGISVITSPSCYNLLQCIWTVAIALFLSFAIVFCFTGRGPSTMTLADFWIGNLGMLVIVLVAALLAGPLEARPHEARADISCC